MNYSFFIAWKDGKDISEMLLGFNEREKEVFNVCCQYIINNGLFNFDHISKTLLGFSANLDLGLYVHIWASQIKTGLMPHTTIVGRQVNTSSVFAASPDKTACNLQLLVFVYILYNVKSVCVFSDFFFLF